MKKQLQKILKLEKEAKSFGFEWSSSDMILDQIISEVFEVKQEIAKKESRKKLQEELGDLFHAVISLIYFLEYDLEETVGLIDEKFNRRISFLKEIMKEHRLISLKGCSSEQILLLWKEVKKREKFIF